MTYAEVAQAARARLAAAERAHALAAAHARAAARGAELAAQAARAVEAAGEECLRAAHGSLAGVATKCLAAVFDDPYQVDIRFERRGKKVGARVVFLQGGLEIDPKDEASGGQIDVAAFALRVACVAASRPRRRRLVVLDEPFGGVKKDLLAKVAALIEELAAEMGFQVVLVTHERELRVGKVVSLPAGSQGSTTRRPPPPAGPTKSGGPG